jgi:multidrug resistance efflux pump
MTDHDKVPDETGKADQTPTTGNAESSTPGAEDGPSGRRSMDPVRRWTLVVLAICLALIGWYLVSDRLTPYTGQARVEAYVVPIAPEVSGTVSVVDVTNNQFVEAGERLLQIDVSRYALALESAEADLVSTQQSVDAATAGLVSAQAKLKSSEADHVKEQRNYERLQSIFKEDPGAISQRRLDGALASLKSAAARVEAAKADLEKARLDLGPQGQDNPRLLAARSAVEQARINLDRTTVVAPDRGLVTDVRVDAGNFAQAGQPLMTFVAIHNIWIQADLTENNLGNVEPGDEVQFVLDVRPGRVFRGRVRSVGYGVSTGNDPLGSLPTIQNQRDWLRDAQRFPVIIDLDEAVLREHLGIRVGSQVNVIVYTGDHGFMNALGRLYIRLVSWLTYLY